MLTPGWWLPLDGEERYLRDLAMHLDAPELRIVEEEDGFYLGSSDFAVMTTTEDVRRRGAELVAVSCGAAEIELGGFRPPRIAATVRVDESGEVQRLTPVSAVLRMPYEVHQNVERLREDGAVEVVEIAPPLPRTEEWAELARHDPDVADALAILGREDVRWHDLYHLFETVESDVGGRMARDGWTTKTAIDRFTQTANSRRAIGREARHAKDKFVPPKRLMELAEAHKLIRGLVRRWLETKRPPPPPRVVRVVEVRSAPRR